MKEFLVLHYGFIEPTDEIMAAWNEWFEAVGERMLAMGGVADGVEISKTGITELPFGRNSLTGYNLIRAESLEEARQIAATNPFIDSIRVYEVRSNA